jgi:predicted lactoylglutathione lyase
MPTKIFVNLPVKDLSRSIDFFTQLGFSFDSQFTDENAACLVISDGIYVMLLVEPFFKSFTTKDIADATRSTEAILALQVETRQRVDELADKVLAVGGQPANDPMDEGFMYGRSFQDVDGHIWEVMCTDPAAGQSSKSGTRGSHRAPRFPRRSPVPAGNLPRRGRRSTGSRCSPPAYLLRLNTSKPGRVASQHHV